MKPLLFKYRLRKLNAEDISFVKATITQHYERGRSYISRELCICKSWEWKQPNGKLKEYATRDLPLRLEEPGIHQTSSSKKA